MKNLLLHLMQLMLVKQRLLHLLQIMLMIKHLLQDLPKKQKLVTQTQRLLQLKNQQM